MLEDDLVQFGTPLTPLDKDNIHSSKAPRLSEQIVTDKQGRRRFHGAFTGGFSAGYFNTVGSRDGFTPSTFVSSRSNRAEKVSRNLPSEFMDEEDLEQFGIASQRIQATSNYEDPNTYGKRKRVPETSGPIPGQPVLEQLLKPVNVTVGMQMLMKLGWKPGQGVGPRLSRREKRKSRKGNSKISVCSDSSDSDGECVVTTSDFAPDDVESGFFREPKSDQFGLGYKPLERGNVLGNNLNSNRNPAFTMFEKKKRVSIQGQAFGIGVFEEEDNDIYMKEDMSDYDFVLGPKKEETRKKSIKSRWDSQVSLLGEVLEGFKLSNDSLPKPKSAPLPTLPPDYQPWHKSLRRRFDTKEPESKGERLSVEERQRLTSNPPSVEIRSGVKTNTASSEGQNEKHISSKFTQSFTEAAEPVGTSTRQDSRPSSALTEWERERQESSKAPLGNRSSLFNMNFRFTTATYEDVGDNLAEGLNDMSKKSGVSRTTKGSVFESHLSEDKKAAKSKMFGSLTQVKIEWHPDKILCKRFNIPHPYPQSSKVGVPSQPKERSSIFDILPPSASQNVMDAPGSAVKTEPAESSAPVLDESEENFGLKVPVTNPPTLDLFKAIFEDSSDDSEAESKDELTLSKSATAGDSCTGRKGSKSESEELEDGSTLSLEMSREGGHESREYKRKSSDEDNLGGRKQMAEEEVVVKNEAGARKASGVFKGIDFTALNQYRRPKAAELEDDVLSDKESKARIPRTPNARGRRESSSSSSISSNEEEEDGNYGPTPLQQEEEEEEYGPAPPPHMLLGGKTSNPAPPKVPSFVQNLSEPVKEKKKKKKIKKKHKGNHKKKKNKKEKRRR